MASRRRKMRHTRVDRLAIVRVDSTRIIFHSINRFAKRLTSRCAWRMAWLVSCCVLIGHRVSPLFENDEVGSGRILSGGILRDNFQNIGSGFVQSLFHCGLERERRRRTTAAGTMQLEPNDAVPHADQLAVSTMRLEIGSDGIETAHHPGFY